MLKIKDNVDLKELERYDFSYDKSQKTYFKHIEPDNLINFVFFQGLGIELYINEKDRIIKCYGGINAEDLKVNEEDIIDLIKADLVEKIGE